MKVKEFREMFKDKHIVYFDANGNNITNKPQIILDCMTVIGSEHCPDRVIIVDCLNEE